MLMYSFYSIQLLSASFRITTEEEGINHKKNIKWNIPAFLDLNLFILCTINFAITEIKINWMLGEY